MLPFGLDDSSAVDLDDLDEPELGPIPREQSGPFASGGGVDEVEYAYGYVLTSNLGFTQTHALL